MEFAAAPLPVEQVYATLQATLSYDAGVRGPAEAQLREWEGDAQPGFIGSLLKVVAEVQAVPEVGGRVGGGRVQQEGGGHARVFARARHLRMRGWATRAPPHTSLTGGECCPCRMGGSWPL